MTQRTSKRLKVAAEKAVATASAAVTTETKATRKAVSKTATVAVTATSTTTTTKTTTKKTTKKKTEEHVAVETETNETVVDATATATDSKAAWGALFTKSIKAKTSSANGEKLWPRPKRIADGVVSDAIQSQIDAFAKFDGVSSTKTGDAKCKLVAWNVNGLRALLKKEDSIHFRAYVAQEDPDVICLSETKIDSDELQKLDDMLPQYEYQYWSSAVKKGYSGTAILSKLKPLSVKDELVVEGDKPEDEGRFLALEFQSFWLVHTYVPNAGMKLDRLAFRTEKWDKAMLTMLTQLEETKPVVWCGDLNVAHQEIDIHDPKNNRNKSPGFTDAERESFSQILDSGFVDSYRHFHPETKQFTYWSYRFSARAKNKGWRIDYFIISKGLVDSVTNTFVRDAVSGSDHVPVGLELKQL